MRLKKQKKIASKQKLEAQKVIEHSTIVAEQALQDGIHARQKAQQAKSLVRKEVNILDFQRSKVVILKKLNRLAVTGVI